MQNEQIKEMMGRIEEQINQRDSALRSVLDGFVRRIMWKLVLENDQNAEYQQGDKTAYMAGDISRIINTMISTARYTDREDGENYPIWDEKAVAKEMERVLTVVRKAGITYQR